jgi:hypothetical protein
VDRAKARVRRSGFETAALALGAVARERSARGQSGASTQPIAGSANCALSTSSSPSNYGTTAQWGSSADWLTGPIRPAAPWQAHDLECDTRLPVWCMED